MVVCGGGGGRGLGEGENGFCSTIIFLIIDANQMKLCSIVNYCKPYIFAVVFFFNFFFIMSQRHNNVSNNMSVIQTLVIIYMANQ